MFSVSLHGIMETRRMRPAVFRTQFIIFHVKMLDKNSHLCYNGDIDVKSMSRILTNQSKANTFCVPNSKSVYDTRRYRKHSPFQEGIK